MYKKTFEIIAKWVAEKTGTTVLFEKDTCPKASVENGTIHLPTSISNDNALGALAVLIHEACHIKHSHHPIDQFVKKKSDFDVYNAIEDIRVDRIAFDILPNIKSFFRQKAKDHIDLTNKPEVPQHVLALCSGILLNEGFRVKNDPVTQKLLDNTNLVNLMDQGTRMLRRGEYVEFKELIREIKERLKISDKDEPDVKFKADKAGSCTDSIATNMDDEIAKVMCPASLWGKGEDMKGGSFVEGVDFDEVTRQQFKELLCIKEKKKLFGGMKLDTDGLINFFTDNFDELFIDEKIRRKKKSKIMFLLDSSGSMRERLIDGVSRETAVRRCCQSIIEILEEVRETESIDIDWEVNSFDYRFHALTKENWQNEYGGQGGTYFVQGMRAALDKFMADYTVTGKRILVVLTDGDVAPGEIGSVVSLIQQHGADIRCLVIGVGTELNGPMAKKITGDNIIIAMENANHVVLETIKTML